MEVEINKTRNVLIFSMTLAFISAACIYNSRMKDSYVETTDPEHCTARLEAAQRQLEMVRKYKKHADDMLTNMQRYRKNDKDRFNDVLENCLVMSQKSVACKEQLESTGIRCRKNDAECIKHRKQVELLTILANMTLMT